VTGTFTVVVVSLRLDDVVSAIVVVVVSAIVVVVATCVVVVKGGGGATTVVIVVVGLIVVVVVVGQGPPQRSWICAAECRLANVNAPKVRNAPISIPTRMRLVQPILFHCSNQDASALTDALKEFFV